MYPFIFLNYLDTGAPIDMDIRYEFIPLTIHFYCFMFEHIFTVVVIKILLLSFG